MQKYSAIFPLENNLEQYVPPDNYQVWNAVFFHKMSERVKKTGGTQHKKMMELRITDSNSPQGGGTHHMTGYAPVSKRSIKRVCFQPYGVIYIFL